MSINSRNDNDLNLNENQLEYLRNSKSKYNFKSAAKSSGAYYLDMRYTIRLRAESLKKKEGICLLIFPAMSTAKNVLNDKGINLRKNDTFVIDGNLFYVAPALYNPKRLRSLLSKKIKYVHCSHIESWREEIFNEVFNVLNKSDCIVDAIISDLKVNDSILQFLESEENLYTQDNFSLENNKFISDSVLERLKRVLSEEKLSGFKFKKTTH